MATTRAPRIVVSVRADGPTLRYELRASRPINRYFSSEKMFVTYDVDLTGVPEHILLIPGLSTLAPIAWILGAELHTTTVDATFLESLQRVRGALRHLYPTIHWAGEVRADAVVTTGDAYLRGTEALLFSGGVDSLASFVSRWQAKPRLVSIWGADVGLGHPEEWQHVVATNGEFAGSRSLDLSLVKTNFRTFFNHYMLRARFFGHFANWYSAVQQGLGLVGLGAPLSYVHGLARIRIPSTHTTASVEPWGSHPAIDNEVRWASTQVLHDGYDLSRQMKLGVIAEHIRTHDLPLQFRVCWGRGRNCSRCTKCCLTMIGLALEGLDPSEHGFRFDAAVLSFIRAQLEGGFMALSDLAVWLWEEIQHTAATRKPIELDGLDAFLTWLAGVSIPDCQAKFKANTRRPRARMMRYLETRSEPAGRWLRTARRHPFP
jgi:hypothetical protein